jgi:2'-5' RNA ligase
VIIINSRIFFFWAAAHDFVSFIVLQKKKKRKKTKKEKKSTGKVMPARQGDALLTVTTALAIVVDSAPLASCIDAVRSVCDAAHPRWMPHINLVYPFVPEKMFDRFALAMQDALADTSPFTIKMGDLGLFGSSTRATLHFEVEEAAVAQVAAIARRLLWAAADTDAVVFKGHLTLAQFPLPAKDLQPPTSTDGSLVFRPPKKLISALHLRSALMEHFKRSKALLGRGFTVREVCLLVRTASEPFRVARSIPLGVRPATSGRNHSRASTVLRALSISDKTIISSLVSPAAVAAAKTWIVSMTTSGKLPKSLTGLRNALASSSCRVRVQLDVDVILAQMLAKGWVRRVAMQTTTGGETVTVIPRELAATLAKKQYSKKGKFKLVPAGKERDKEVLQQQRRFRLPTSAPGIAISRQAAGRGTAKAAAMLAGAEPSTVFGNPELFGMRIALWLGRMSGACQKGKASGPVERTLTEAAFLHQLMDCARLPVVVPADDVIRGLMLDRVVAVSPAGDVSYDPRAATSAS